MTHTKERVGHTPGPWRYEVGTKTIRSVPANYWLASMDSFDGAVDHTANARLIAAAPDGLEAAELAYLALLRAGSSYRLRVQTELIALRSFIAKATGRSEQDIQETAESMVAYE